MSKWGKQYWNDFVERVASTGVYGLITLFTMNSTTDLGFEKLWPVVFLPMVLNALKNLAANLPDTSLPTASLARVSSTGTTKEGERGAFQGGFIWALAVVGIVLLVLVLVGVLR